MAFTPTDPTKAEVRITGTAPNQQLDFYIPRGAKGDPGGFTAGTDLGTTDLNQITTAGLYKQANSANATLTANYPVNALTGSLEVLEQSPGANGGFLQRYTIIWGSASGRLVYQRTKTNGSWQPWRAFTDSRVDQTAGRAIYKWDDLNQREQLIYGDTGVRRIEAGFINGWTAAIGILRRVGNVVSFGLYSVNPAAQTNGVAYPIPSGFRPGSYGGTIGNAVQMGGGFTILQVNAIGEVYPNTTATSCTGVVNLMTWTTQDAWPPILPGTAAGSIPNV